MSSFALQGCLVSTAGIDNDTQQEIRRLVQEHGGTFSSKAGANMTHLIATTADSSEYRRVSKSNGPIAVSVVTPEWIFKCHEVGKKVPVDKYQLPPLAGLVICATNFGEKEKMEIKKAAKEGGAEYKGDLSRSCTHLIAQRPSGRKWEYAVASGKIHIVRADWIFACVLRNRLLDESNFRLCSDENGDCDSQPLYPGDAVTIPKTILPNMSIPESGSLELGYNLVDIPSSLLLDSCCFYLVGSADGGKFKMARKRVLTLAALGGASVLPRLSNLVTHVIVTDVPIARIDVFMLRKAQSRGVQIVGMEWLQLSLQRRVIMDPAACPAPLWDTGESLPSNLNASKGLSPAVASTVFQGVRMALAPLSLRDAESAAEMGVLLKSGRGIVLRSEPDGNIQNGVPTHALCPGGLQDNERKMLQKLRSNGDAVEAVTEEWIRVCLDEGHLVPVSSCILFSPFPYKLPLADFVKQGVSLTITGFQLGDSLDRDRRRNNLSKLAMHLGAEYSERMSRRCTTHLIASKESASSQKYLRAKEWGIPVVSEEWLLACARAGVMLPLESYAYRPGQAVLGLAPLNGSDRQGGHQTNTVTAGANEFVPMYSANGIETEFATPAPRRRKARSKLSGESTGSVEKRRTTSANPENEKLMQVFAAGLNEISRQERQAKEMQNARIRPEDRGDATVGYAVDKGSPDDGTSPVQLSGERDWSLGGSQGQVIVRKDLNTPRLSNFREKRGVKATLSSRTAKSRKNKRKSIT